MTELKSVGIRIEGTAEQLKEAQRRLRQVIDLSDGKEYPSKRYPGLNLVYYWGYFYENDSPLDALEANQSYILELEERLGRLMQENKALKQQLCLVPQPRPYDVVLGTRHRQ